MGTVSEDKLGPIGISGTAKGEPSARERAHAACPCASVEYPGCMGALCEHFKPPTPGNLAMPCRWPGHAAIDAALAEERNRFLQEQHDKGLIWVQRGEIAELRAEEGRRCADLLRGWIMTKGGPVAYPTLAALADEMERSDV